MERAQSGISAFCICSCFCFGLGGRSSRRQRSRQIAARVAGAAGGHGFGPALNDQAAAERAAFGAEVNEPVGGFDHIQVVLDDDDGVACIA